MKTPVKSSWTWETHIYIGATDGRWSPQSKTTIANLIQTVFQFFVLRGFFKPGSLFSPRKYLPRWRYRSPWTKCSPKCLLHRPTPVSCLCENCSSSTTCHRDDASTRRDFAAALDTAWTLSVCASLCQRPRYDDLFERAYLSSVYLCLTTPKKKKNIWQAGQG